MLARRAGAHPDSRGLEARRGAWALRGQPTGAPWMLTSGRSRKRPGPPGCLTPGARRRVRARGLGWRFMISPG